MHLRLIRKIITRMCTPIDYLFAGEADKIFIISDSNDDTAIIGRVEKLWLRGFFGIETGLFSYVCGLEGKMCAIQVSLVATMAK